MPEQVIRFGVRNAAGRRSGTWRCWWNGSQEDLSFYVASRQLEGGDFKLSFHGTGDCNVSFTQRTYEQFEEGAAPPGRYIERWARPDPFRPALTQVCNVVIPGGFATEQITHRDANVHWIQDPGLGRAVEFGVFVATPCGPDSWHGLQLIDSFSFPNGDAVGVAYNESAYVAPRAAQTNPRFVWGGRETLAQANGLHAILYAVNEQTRLRIFTDTPVTVTPRTAAP